MQVARPHVRMASCSAPFTSSLCLRPRAVQRASAVRASPEGATLVSRAGAMASTIAAAALLLMPMPALADGLEALQGFPLTVESEGAKSAKAAKTKALDENFQNSGSLKRLLEKSAANKDKHAKAIKDKYCYRQAEMGVGDCGGLQLIPGMTKNGLQSRPSWMDELMHTKADPATIAADGSALPAAPTLETMFDAQARQ